MIVAIAFTVCPFGYFEVESGLVYIYDSVGVERLDVFLAEGDIAHHGAQVCHDFEKSHECEVADVFDADAAYGGHIVAPPETNVGIGVVA